MKMLNFKYVFSCFVLFGLVQYAPSAYEAMLNGGAVMWQMDDAAMDDAGALRYLKDIYVVIFSAYWVFGVGDASMHKDTKFRFYVLWILLVLLFGVLAYLQLNTPAFFAVAGLRWIMLLHASVGVFFMARGLRDNYQDQRFIGYVVLSFVFLEAGMAYSQAASVSSALEVALGTSRVPGFFSNAGVAAGFALGMSLVSVALQFERYWKRILICVLCFYIALASGTRYAMISIFLVMVALLYEWLSRQKSGGVRVGLLAVFFPAVGIIGVLGFQVMLEVVNRGDIFASQFESGGRAANFWLMVERIASSELLDFMFGRGIGVGTNAGYTMALARGIVPESIYFNWLVDNSIVTIFFQFGAVGSLVFWLGVVAFFACVARGIPASAHYKYWLYVAVLSIAVLGGNVFEQYYLMICLFAALGMTYWTSSLSFRRLR